MSDEKAPPLPSWAKWIIRAVWVATALAVLACATIHPRTSATVSLTVSEVSIKTNSERLFSPTQQNSVLITGLQYAQLVGELSTAGRQPTTNTLLLNGTSFSTCSFSLVRSEPLEIAPGSLLRLVWNESTTPKAITLAIRADQPMHGRLSGQPSERELRSGFSCNRVRVDNAPPAQSIHGQFAASGGGSVNFATDPDARIDIEPREPLISDTQISIEDTLRFSRTEPRSSEEKTVLRKPANGEYNEITFDDLKKTVQFNDNDLVTVVPARDLWLRKLTAADGLRLEFHGVVANVTTGAGPTDLRTVMPTLLDQFLNMKGIFALVPSIAGGVIAILEKMAILPGKKKEPTPPDDNDTSKGDDTSKDKDETQKDPKEAE